MFWQFYVQNGKVLGCTEVASNAIADPSTHFVTADPALGVADLATLVPVMQGGIITGMQIAAPSAIFLHVSITGGDGDTPPGMPNDGSKPLGMTAEVKDASGTIITTLNGAWRITIRDSTGAEFDVVRITLSGGQASVSYPGNGGKTGHCFVRQNDFTSLTLGSATYQVVLVNDTPGGGPEPEFKVYRPL